MCHAEMEEEQLANAVLWNSYYEINVKLNTHPEKLWMVSIIF